MSANNTVFPVPGAATPVGAGHGSGHAVGAGDGVGLVLTGPLTTTLAVAALVLGAATAGVAILAPALPRSRRIELVVESAAAMLVGVLAIGWLGGGWFLLPLLPPAFGAVVVATLTHRGLRRTACAAGVVLLGLLSLAASAAETDPRHLARAAYVVAAAAWLGSVLLAAVADPRPARRRLRWAASVATVVAVVALFVRSWAAGLRFDSVSVGSLLGLTTLAELLLLTGAVALAALGFTGTQRGRWVTAAVVALGLTTGVTASSLTPPAERAETGRSLLRTVALGNDEVTVSVVPQRPGTNLVHTTKAGVLLNGVPAVARSGAPGGWAVLDLPAGTRELSVEADGDRQRLRLDLGETPVAAGLAADLAGPDGPECLSSIIAGSINGRQLDSCPSDQLEPRDAVAIRAAVDFLAKRGAPHLHIINDASPRAEAASAVARETAAARHLPLTSTLDVNSGVLVVAGWDYGGQRLTREALGLSTVYGTYTAPWLAVNSILGKQTGAVTLLDFDPKDPPTQRYLAALRANGLIDLATPAGYRGWDGGPAESGPRVFTAAQVSVFPADVGGGDSHGESERWIPNGTMAAVTGPLPY
jgi:hypothetical protein